MYYVLFFVDSDLLVLVLVWIFDHKSVQKLYQTKLLNQAVQKIVKVKQNFLFY